MRVFGRSNALGTEDAQVVDLRLLGKID